MTKIVNGLLLLGAEVIYESMYDVHVSGHACQEEQKLMLTLTRPKYFLPVHGEYKQLKKHALTAASLGIPTSNILIAENGSNVILSRDEIKLGEPVTAGAVMVDGLGVGDVGNVVLRDRKHLSEDGLVIIVATVDSKTGKVLAGPDLVSRGPEMIKRGEIDEATIGSDILDSWLADDTTKDMVSMDRPNTNYTYFYMFNFMPFAHEFSNWNVEGVDAEYEPDGCAESKCDV